MISPYVGGYQVPTSIQQNSQQFYEDNPSLQSENGLGQIGPVVDIIDSDSIGITNFSRRSPIDSFNENRTVDLSGVDTYIYEISDVSGNIPAFENVTIDSLTNLPIDASDISFTEDSISIGLGGTTVAPGDFVILDIEFAGDGGFVPLRGDSSDGITNAEYADRELGIS